MLIYVLKTQGSSTFEILEKSYLKHLPTIMCKVKIDWIKYAFWLQNVKWCEEGVVFHVIT